MANTCRREFEGSDGRAVVEVVGVDGQQVLEVVALDAAGLLAAVGHQPAWKDIVKQVLEGKQENLVLMEGHERNTEPELVLFSRGQK